MSGDVLGCHGWVRLGAEGVQWHLAGRGQGAACASYKVQHSHFHNFGHCLRQSATSVTPVPCLMV